MSIPQHPSSTLTRPIQIKLTEHQSIAHSGLGHLALQFSSAMGFRTIALSFDGSKEALARQLGADAFVDGSRVNQAQELQKLGGVKVVVSTAPNAAATALSRWTYPWWSAPSM